MSRTRLELKELHWPLVVMAGLVALLGIYNLHSAAAARDPDLYLTQLTWMLAASAAVSLFLFVDYRITEGVAYPFYAVVCLLLLAVLAQGKVAKGAERWLELGPVTFQPSQLAKIAVVLCMARYFSQRADEGGYTVGSLLKPLNPSRPLAVVVVLAVFWSKPWLVDPVGELARLVHSKIGAAVPQPGDLAWFRVLLVILLIGILALAILMLVRWEQASALLNPWPPGRRRRLIGAAVVMAVGLGVLLGLVWNAPLVRDPSGVAIAYLAGAAGPGGPHHELASSITLRLVLVAATGLYLGASLFTLRHGVTRMIDILVAPIDLMALPFLLILVQPDLGTAGIVFLVGMTMVLVVGMRLRSLAILGVFGAVMSIIAWFGVLHDYQKRRILTFLDPEHDVQGAGWNAFQSMIAVGSGRWAGKGHMGGTQTQLSFLPEQHTDFAFSVWAEEQGFLGCMLLVGLYVALIVMALSIAAEARERYGALLATGAGAIIMWQALINISMVIGVFPVVGITLPLFSYGGSSVITVIFAIGILLNVHWRRRAHY